MDTMERWVENGGGGKKWTVKREADISVCGLEVVFEGGFWGGSVWRVNSH